MRFGPMIERFGPSFQRFLHNSAAQTFGQAVNLFSQICVIPAFFHFWSKARYGEWLVITSVPMLLWTLESGLAGLASNRMTVASGAGDWVRANVIFHNVLVVQGLLSLLILIVAGVYVEVGNVRAVFGFKLMSRHEANEVVFIMIAYMVLGYGIGLLRAVFRASMLEARGVMFWNLQKLSEFFVVVEVLYCHGQAVALAFAMTANMGAWVMIGYLDSLRTCPRIRFALGPLSMPQLRSMLIDGLPVFAATLAGALFLQGYLLIVNRMLGSASAAMLAAIRPVSRMLLQLTGIVSTASASEMARTFGAKDWDGYLRLLKIVVATTVWAAVAGALGLAIFGPWVVAKLTWGRVLVSHLVMLFFGISVACQCGWNVCSTTLFSTNMHHALNYAYLALTLVGLGVSTFAVHLLGFTGVPLVMMVVDVILLSWGLILCRMKLDFIPISTLRGILHPSFYLSKAGGLIRSMSR